VGFDQNYNFGMNIQMLLLQTDDMLLKTILSLRMCLEAAGRRLFFFFFVIHKLFVTKNIIHSQLALKP
jgi:hypothetical protein